MSDRVIRPTKSKFLRYLKSYLPFWKKKRIGFYGYFGHGDLGDDASFSVGRDLLGEDVIPMSKRCYAFNPHILKGLLIGGGAVLKGEYPFIPRRLLMRDEWSFPVILLSAGVGCDYNKEFTEQAKDKIRKLCHICDYITVRDKLSQEFLNNLGFNRVSILPHLELALEDKFKKFTFNKEGFTVGIALTPHPEFGSHIFEKMIYVFSQLTDYLTDNGNNVIYLPFEKSISENTKETVVIQEIIKRLRKKGQGKGKGKVRVLEGDIEPQEMLFAIRNYCDAMVCMRLHSAVFATNAGIPFFCVSYNLMHKGFLEMLELLDLELSIYSDFSFEALRDKFEYILKDYSLLAARLVEKKNDLRSIIYKEISNIRNILTPQQRKP